MISLTVVNDFRYKTKRRQQQELGALVNSGNARRVAVRVLVHPDEHLRGLPLRGSGQLPGQMSSPQIHPANKALGGFPYYCLPYHPLLCPPLHATHVQVQSPIMSDFNPNQISKIKDEKWTIDYYSRSTNCAEIRKFAVWKRRVIFHSLWRAEFESVSENVRLCQIFKKNKIKTSQKTFLIIFENTWLANQQVNAFLRISTSFFF